MIYTLIKKDNSGNVAAVMSFDSITSFDESWTATVTTQTVEYGFDITDNINIEAPSYSIEAVISSYSIFDPDREIYWNGEDFDTNGVKETNHITARDKLVELFKSRSMLSLVESSENSYSNNDETKYEDLQNGHFNEIPDCVITSLSISNPTNASEAFLVSLKIQKISIAKVSVVELTKEEMNPLLEGVVVKPTVTSSQAKTVDGESIDGESVASQSGDISAVDENTPRDGMGWYEVYDQKSKELKVIKDRIAAEKELAEYMARTNEYCDLYQNSSGYYKRCRKT